MIRRELSFVRAALFIFLMLDATSRIETQEEEGGYTSIEIPQSVFPYPWTITPGMVPDVESEQSVHMYPWEATLETETNSDTQADQRKSTIPIQDDANGGPSIAYSQGEQQERRYLTQDKGNMNDQPNGNIVDKRQLIVAYGGDPNSQSAGEYPWIGTTGTGTNSSSQADQWKSAIPKEEERNGGTSSYHSEPGGQQEHRSLIPDLFTKRNKIGKATRHYRRK